MNIGFIGAISKEIKIFDKKIKQKKIIYKNYKINLVKFKKFNVIIIKSGIGKVSSAIAATLLIKKFYPKFIINIGTAGSLSKKINISDIIISNKNTYHDVDITIFGYKYGQIPKNPYYFLSNEKLINISKNCAKKLKIKNKIGEICTGDSFINNKKKKKFIKKKFPKAMAVDMESASIAQVCYKFSIPFISIRLISDLSNKNSKSTFKKSINNHYEKMTLLIQKILTEYK